MTKKLPVLIINSYAGSLSIAAHQERHPVVGSYEDSGYGLSVQKANYPTVDYRATCADWPVKPDLSGKLVIAHPPCAAFSAQNNSKSKRGCDAAKFQQTKHAIDYALGGNCEALAVESVCGALDGAREVHEALAAKHGYTVHRILQNAVSFGVPQWRERFWVVFLHQRHGGLLRFERPDGPIRFVKDILEESPDLSEDVEHLCKLEFALAKQKTELRRKLGAGSVALVNGKGGPGPLHSLLYKQLKALGRGAEFPDLRATAHEFCVSVNGTVMNHYMLYTRYRVLDQNGFSPTLLGYSWWGVNGRNLSRAEWQRLMGFPGDYVFPSKDKRDLRFYLSRGVCPPVARWVLQTMQRTVTPSSKKSETLPAGALLDLRPKKKALLESLPRFSGHLI